MLNVKGLPPQFTSVALGENPLGALQNASHRRVGWEMEAARAPEIVFVVPTELHNSSRPSGGTQQKAEGSTHWQAPGVRRKRVSRTQTSCLPAHGLVHAPQSRQQACSGNEGPLP